MTLNNKFNPNPGLNLLATIVTSLQGMVKTKAPSAITAALESIIMRLSYELSGRTEKLDMTSAYKAVLRVPCGPALVSMTIYPLELDLSYYPARFASTDPDEGNRSNWVLKVTRTGRVLFNSPAAAEFMRVLEACHSSGEKIEAGAITYREVYPANMDSHEHISGPMRGGNSSSRFRDMNP